LRFDGIVRELCNCFLESVTLVGTKFQAGHFWLPPIVSLVRDRRLSITIRRKRLRLRR
jgi:hypothetical protein